MHGGVHNTEVCISLAFMQLQCYRPMAKCGISEFRNSGIAMGVDWMRCITGITGNRFESGAKGSVLWPAACYHAC